MISKILIIHPRHGSITIIDLKLYPRSYCVLGQAKKGGNFDANLRKSQIIFNFSLHQKKVNLEAWSLPSTLISISGQNVEELGMRLF